MSFTEIKLGSTVTQTLSFAGLTVQGNSTNGVYFEALAMGTGSVAGQYITITGDAGTPTVSITGSTYGVKVEGTASVSYWGRISGGASATINSGPGAPLLGVADQQVTNYGEAGLGLNVISKTSGCARSRLRCSSGCCASTLSKACSAIRCTAEMPT